MKIGVDISSVIYGTGVSVYTKNLIEALLKLDQKNEYVFFFASLRRKLAEAGLNLRASNASVKSFKIPPTLLDGLWNFLHFYPVENFVGKVDVFHASDWTQPPSAKAKLVTTIHDLSFLRWPESVHPKVLMVQKRRLSWVKKEADLIIAVSEATKKEIVELLKIPEKKIKVIHEALPADFKKIKPQVNFKKYGISKPYLLASGSQAPRKNIERVIQAFSFVKKKHDLQLVITGNYQPRVKISKDIVLTGFAGKEEWAGLIEKAQALVYPSLYEGFGLPILEAFYLGTPVVTSNLSSMKEIAGQGAVLVEPASVEAIVQGIEKILKDSGFRQGLIKTARKRVTDFSWEKAARQTLKVYQQLAA